MPRHIQRLLSVSLFPLCFKFIRRSLLKDSYSMKYLATTVLDAENIPVVKSKTSIHGSHWAGTYSLLGRWTSSPQMHVEIMAEGSWGSETKTGKI